MATNLKQTVALIDLAVVSDKEKRTPRVEAALRRLDGLTLLEWCIRRLSEATLIDTIVVTGPPSYRELISQTGLCNARWMPSALDTPVRRAKELLTVALGNTLSFLLHYSTSWRRTMARFEIASVSVTSATRSH